MTKKTNSLLFRLGINSLWQSKTSNFLKSLDVFILEKTLKNLLIKFNWNIIYFKWFSKKVIIQVFNRLDLSKFLKQNIFKYYKKFKNIKELSEKFNLNYIYIKCILKKIKGLIVKKKKNSVFMLSFFFYF